MVKNIVKHKLLEGKMQFIGWLHLNNPFSAEIASATGWDAITVDMQHGLSNMNDILTMLQAIHTNSNSTPIVRVPANNPSDIMKVLDLGALGIICPLINDAKQAENFVQSCLYPPKGIRSKGPLRAKEIYGEDYLNNANDEILSLAMIETHEALKNRKSIINTKGLSGVFVGTSDLELSLAQHHFNDNLHEEVNRALQAIASDCHNENKIAGLWVNSMEKAKVAIGMGYTFVAVKSDFLILKEQHQSLLKKLKSN